MVIADLWSTFSGRILLSSFLFGLSLLLLFYWPARISLRGQFSLIAVLALFLPVLSWNIPVSDDVNRYLWEGRLILNGENPYEVAANDLSREKYHDVVYEGMNHKGETTIYPPISQWIFSVSSFLWNDLRVFKIVAWLGVLFCLPCLYFLLGRKREHISWLGFYLCNPVNVLSFAGEGHFDSLMICFLIFALCLAKSEKPLWAITFLAISINIKMVALFVAPYFLWNLPWREWWKAGVISSAVVLIPALPFLGATPQLIKGVLRFGGDFTGNASLHPLLQTVLVSSQAVSILSLLAMCAVVAWCYFKKPKLEFAILLTLGVLILCAPLVTYWYVSWLLPFALLFKQRAFAVWWLSATIILYFAAWWAREQTGIWEHPLWASLIQWIPVYAALIYQYRNWLKNSAA